MHDALRVNRRQRIADRTEDAHRLLAAQSSGGAQAFVNRFPIDEFHDDRGPSVQRKKLMQPHHVRVAQAGLNARFVQEPLGQMGALGRLVQHLDCHHAPQPGVYGAIHLSHSARAEKVDQAIVADDPVG